MRRLVSDNHTNRHVASRRNVLEARCRCLVGNAPALQVRRGSGYGPDDQRFGALALPDLQAPLHRPDQLGRIGLRIGRLQAVKLLATRDARLGLEQRLQLGGSTIERIGYGPATRFRNLGPRSRPDLAFLPGEAQTGRKASRGVPVPTTVPAGPASANATSACCAARIWLSKSTGSSAACSASSASFTACGIRGSATACWSKQASASSVYICRQKKSCAWFDP